MKKNTPRQGRDRSAAPAEQFRQTGEFLARILAHPDVSASTHNTIQATIEATERCVIGRLPANGAEDVEALS